MSDFSKIITKVGSKSFIKSPTVPTKKDFTPADPLGAKQQEMLDAYLSKFDGNLGKAQEEIINNPEYYRQMFYGGTQQGRPGAKEVPWELSIFKNGNYQKEHYKALMNSGTKSVAAITAGGLAVEAKEAEASPLTTAFARTLSTGTVRQGSAIEAQAQVKEAQLKFDEITKLENSTLDDRMAFMRDDTAHQTDAEILYAVAREQYATMSKVEAAYKYNLSDTWTSLIEGEINETGGLDFEWVSSGRAEWFKANKPYLDPFFIEEWEKTSPEDLPATHSSAKDMVSRYAEEMEYFKKNYEGGSLGIFEGLVNDIVTGLLSPQELALAVATLGYSKWATSGERAVKAVTRLQRYAQMSKKERAIRKYSSAALITGALGLTAETARQRLQGIDLNNEGTVLLIGGFFGVGVKGVGDLSQGLKARFKSMDKEEQDALLDEMVTYVKEQQELSKLNIVEEPVGTPRVVPISGKDGGTISQTFNPSPLLRLYDKGNKAVYDLISKIAYSKNTLVDSKGNLVAQSGENAQQINKVKYQGAHNALVAKMEAVRKRLNLGHKDFGQAVDDAYRQQASVFRSVQMERSALKDLLGSLEKEASSIVKKNEGRTAKGQNPLKSNVVKLLNLRQEISRHTKALSGLDVNTVKRINSESPDIDEAVLALEDFYKVFNIERYNLEVRDLQKGHKTQLDALRSKDSTTPEAIKALETEQGIALRNLELEYKDSHLGYSPRYFDKHTMEYQPTLLELAQRKTEKGKALIVKKNIEHRATVRAQLYQAMLDSPYTAALKKHSPEAYKKHVESLGDTVDSMVSNLTTAEGTQILRDITSQRTTGRPSKFAGRSDIARRIDVDETQIGDYTLNDWAAVTQGYAHEYGHKLSMREALGVSSLKEFTDDYMVTLTKTLEKDPNFTAKDRNRILEDVLIVVETGFGSRQFRKNEGFIADYLGVMRSFTNAIFSPGFGVATLPELGPVVAAGGRDILHQAMPAIRQVIKDYKRVGFDENSGDFFKAMGIGGGIQNSLVASRMGDGTLNSFNTAQTVSRRLEDAGRKVANWGYHTGGFHAITSTFKFASASAFQMKVHRVGGNILKGTPLTSGNAKYFARLGLTPEDMIAISKQPFKDKKGIENYSMQGWEPSVRKKMVSAMQRAVDEAVLEPSAYDLPGVMTRGDTMSGLTNTLLQYSRFPIAAYNSLVRNGLSDKDAKQGASAITSFILAAGYLMLREEYEISVGSKREGESRYDFDRRDGMRNLVSDAFGRTGQASLLPKILTTGTSILDVEDPLSGYTMKPGDVFQGAGLGVTSKIRDVAVGTPGKEVEDLAGFVPVIGRNPVAGPLLKSLVK